MPQVGQPQELAPPTPTNKGTETAPLAADLGTVLQHNCSTTADPELTSPPISPMPSKIVAAWPNLPEHIRLAIIALVDASTTPKKPM